jgi:hypothetical protein
MKNTITLTFICLLLAVVTLAQAPQGILYQEAARNSSGTGMGDFNNLLTGLMPGRNYHFRSYLINTQSVFCGNEFVLTTPCTSPVTVQKHIFCKFCKFII